MFTHASSSHTCTVQLVLRVAHILKLALRTDVRLRSFCVASISVHVVRTDVLFSLYLYAACILTLALRTVNDFVVREAFILALTHRTDMQLRFYRVKLICSLSLSVLMCSRVC